MVRLSRDLLAGHVVEIGISHGKVFDGLFQRGGSAVVQHDHPEALHRIILIDGTANSVHDHIILLTAAGHKHVDSRAFIAGQTKLWSTALLGRHHCPTVVHQRRNHDRNFDTDKHPCPSIADSRGVLSRDNAVDSQTKVKQIDSGVGKG